MKGFASALPAMSRSEDVTTTKYGVDTVRSSSGVSVTVRPEAVSVAVTRRPSTGSPSRSITVSAVTSAPSGGAENSSATAESTATSGDPSHGVTPVTAKRGSVKTAPPSSP
ncbi:hypothetical protein COSO111634_23440 [Corallococcus soli]